VFRKAIDSSRTLHSFLLAVVQAFVMQASSTALANGRSTIEARLARWLLMAHDRVMGDAMLLKAAICTVVMCVLAPPLCSASAQWNWSLLPGDSKEVALYVDKGRIEKNGPIRNVWELLDSQKARSEFLRSQNNIQVPYFSLVMRERVDCSQHTIGLLAWTEYMGHLGTGAVVAASKVSPKDIQPNSIVPGSIGESVARAVC